MGHFSENPARIQTLRPLFARAHPGECGTIEGVSFVWVTGLSGTGKSSVCQALIAQGHSASDADRDGFSRWVDRETEEPVEDPPHPVPSGWLERFAWEIDVERVRALAAEPRTKSIFLCGSVENELDVWEYFDRVVCLVIDDETTRRRLAGRTTNAFGKNPEELAAVLGWNRVVAAKYRELGASVVDATRPLDVVVRAVIDVAGRS